jgi:translocator protein
VTRYLSLVVFLLLVAAAALFGTQFEPGAWHAGLQKPAWNPPNWVFGPVWSLLYVLIAIAGWLAWRARDRLLLALWGVQLLLNALWSWLFFGLRLPFVALADIVLLLLVIIAFIVVAWPRERAAAWLFMPYAAWVGFATALNAAIALLNR